MTPEHARFVNEIVRPMSERLRDLVVDLEAIGPDVDRLLPEIAGEDPATVVPDGREAEGVSRLTAADVAALASVRSAVLELATPAARAVIAKACVRPAI